MHYYRNIKFPKVNIKSSCEMKYSETDYVVDALQRRIYLLNKIFVVLL